jgi:hypothetical protein
MYCYSANELTRTEGAMRFCETTITERCGGYCGSCDIVGIYDVILLEYMILMDGRLPAYLKIEFVQNQWKSLYVCVCVWCVVCGVCVGGVCVCVCVCVRLCSLCWKSPEIPHRATPHPLLKGDFVTYPFALNSPLRVSGFKYPAVDTTAMRSDATASDHIW